MTIIVNGVSKNFSGATHIDYEDVCVLAGKSGSPSVAYKCLSVGDSHRSGMMHPGCEPVLLAEHMIFSCMHTDNA